MNLPEEFLNRMKERLGTDFPAFLRSYETPPCRGLRVNALKIGAEEFARRAPFPLGARIDREPLGFYVGEEKAGSDPYHFAGLYYLQEPSAMSVNEYAASCKKARVLDLCAAPGGKTTSVAAQMNGEGILISNEIDGGRAKILSQNVERMGIKNCAVVSATPAQLAARFPAYFDTVLVDAPCSGEGMFKKEPAAIPHWSPQNVKLCAARQREILGHAAEMLCAGGRLIYSTCTFAEEEDETQIEEFLKAHPEFERISAHKSYPHEEKGEGHFRALLCKTKGETRTAKPYPVRRNAQAIRAFSAFAESFLNSPPVGEITTLADGRMYLTPAGMPALDVRTLRLGTELGEFDGKVFKPAHALAMSLKRDDCARFVSLSREASERYLRGETLETKIPDGWCVVGVEEFPLGLGKCVGGTVKNHCPKALRKR